MKFLIIFAHNEPESFCAALLHHSVKTLESQGHEVKVSNLHAMNFNPIADKTDFKDPKNHDYCVYALEQRHGWQNKTLAPDIIQEAEKLIWCDAMIWHFPLYWFSVPAILKGWIDRVFLSGAIYGGKRFYDQGAMKGKRASLCFTAGSRDNMFGKEAIHGELNDMMRPLLRGSLGYVGFDVIAPFVAYHIPYISHDERQIFFTQYDDYLANFFTAPCLQFPSPRDFGFGL